MNMLSYEFKQSLYSPTGLVDLGTRLVTTVGEAVGKDPNGEHMTNALKAALDNLVVAIEREKSNPFTSEIRDKDAARENNLLMIRDIIKANTHNAQDSAVREAANALRKVYNIHGANITKMGNADESSAIRYLIEFLMNSDNRPKCELLGLVPVVEALGKSQDDLDSLYAERSRIASQLEKVTISSAKRETENAIRAFLGFLDVIVEVNGDDGAALRDQAGHIIREVEALARGHRTRMHNGEEGQPEEPLKQAA